MYNVIICITVVLFQPYHHLSATITISLLILPPFLLSIFSTVNFHSISSLKILYRHPSLIILPTFTFFTFSKTSLCNGDSRVIFSRKFTWLNVAVSTLGLVVWRVWSYFKYDKWYNVNVSYSLISILPLSVLSILLTALFLHTDKLCGCCCNPREQLSVYDPDLNKRFIMVDGEVVEDPEDDVETSENDEESGNNACCGCFISISNLSNLLE